MDAVERAQQQWERQYPHIDIGPLAIFGRVRRVTELLQKRSDAVLESHGITRADFDIISVLARAERAMTPTEISQETLTSAPGTTKRIKRLLEAGLVAREENIDDRRSAWIRLAPPGHDLVEPVLHSISELETDIASQLSESSRAGLRMGLERLLAVLESRHTDG